MMLPELGVRRPVTTAMVFIAVVVLGGVALSRLGLDIMPEVEVPAVSVITAYPGAGPQEVETRITKLIEGVVATVPNVDEVRSLSLEELSAVTVKFDWGVDLNEVTNDVRDKVDMVKNRLPEEIAYDPVLFKFDLAMFPVVVIGVTAEESYPRLVDIIEDKLADPLKRVPGVATAFLRGGLKREIQVFLDGAKLNACGLSASQVAGVLAAQNLSNPGGHLKIGAMDYLVRTPEEFTGVGEIGAVVVARQGSVPVHLRDIAEVQDGFQEKNEDIYIDGHRAIGVIVQKQSGANTVDVSRKVRAKLKNLQKGLPPDVKARIVFDGADFIRGSITNLRDTLLWAGLFVFLVTLFFLRTVRASLIVAVAIPVSLIITFILMYGAGFTINQVSLSSLAIAMGMVVDNAIVVLDNIQRHREKGTRPAEAAIFGTSEVGMAITASTLTTVAIFLPIVFVSGLTRVLFGQLALVITMALVSSLVAALMLVPMLCSKYLKVAAAGSGRRSGLGFYALTERMFRRLDDGYGALMGWALAHRKTVLLGAVLLLVGTLGVAGRVGTEFLPEQDQNWVRVDLELPIGTRFEKTGEVSHEVARIIREKVPELSTCFERYGIGELGIGSLLGHEETSYTGQVKLCLVTKSARKASPRQIVERLRPEMEKIPGVKIRFGMEDPLASLIFGGGKALAVDIFGHDLQTGREYAGQVARVLESIAGVSDVEISRQMRKPEFQVQVDRDKAASLGLDVTTVGKTIEYLFSGATATKYREAGDEYDLFVRLRPEDRRGVEDLRETVIANPAGAPVRLSNVAEVKRGLGPTKIERKNQQRVISVGGNIYGRDLGSVVREAEEKLARLYAPPGFEYAFSGAREQQVEAFQLLFAALFLGMLLVYMVMASQFESLRDPFIIFLSIPFAFIGAVWALALAGQTLSVISFIGVVMLVGIVVNNGIVLISYIGILRRRGLSVKEAVIAGGHSRLRPILMTTLTTVLGLAPLALSRGEGSEIWVPLALTVIGGLSVSTLVTLILMPTLYSIFEGKKKTADSGQWAVGSGRCAVNGEEASVGPWRRGQFGYAVVE